MKLEIIIDHQQWIRPLFRFGLFALFSASVILGIINPVNLILTGTLTIAFLVMTRLVTLFVPHISKHYVTGEHLIERQLGIDRSIAWTDVNEKNLHNWGIGPICIYDSYFPISFPSKHHIRNQQEVLEFVEQHGLRNNPLIISCFGAPDAA